MQISSHILLVLLLVSFTVQKLFILMKSQKFIFLLFLLPLEMCHEKVAVADVKEVAAYVLLYDSDGFLSHIEAFHPFGVYLCVWCERVVKFHSFACCCLVFPTRLVEETVFFPTGYSFLLCQRLIDHRVVGPFLGFLFCSIDLCICFYASTYTVLITTAL